MAKLKRSRRLRTCSNCSKTIEKGQLYSNKTESFTDSEGQSLDGGQTWVPFTLTHKLTLCLNCTL